MSHDQPKPEIAYPCSWTYRIVCSDEDAVRAALAGILGELEHTLVSIRSSRQGTYRTLQLDLVVCDEAQRDRIFAALSSLPEVRLVL